MLTSVQLAHTIGVAIISVLADIYTARVTIYYLTARYFLRPLARITIVIRVFIVYTCVNQYTNRLFEA